MADRSAHGGARTWYGGGCNSQGFRSFDFGFAFAQDDRNGDEGAEQKIPRLRSG